LHCLHPSDGCSSSKRSGSGSYSHRISRAQWFVACPSNSIRSDSLCLLSASVQWLHNGRFAPPKGSRHAGRHSGGRAGGTGTRRGRSPRCRLSCGCGCRRLCSGSASGSTRCSCIGCIGRIGGSSPLCAGQSIRLPFGQQNDPANTRKAARTHHSHRIIITVAVADHRGPQHQHTIHTAAAVRRPICQRGAWFIR
jgi:hypothetical protein